MNYLKFPSFTFAVLVLYFFIGVQCLDWQGYGNMSSSNLTTIWGYINPNIDKTVRDANTAAGNFDTTTFQALYRNFCTNFSNYLNEKYDPAWNVFVISTTSNKDSILYGYAFREHWMWYNGYVSNEYYIAFIIWKDYNCQIWTNIDRANGGTLNRGGVAAALVGVNDVSPDTDIWGKTKKFMNNLATKDGFSGDDKAFTVIASEDAQPAAYFGRACLAGATKFCNSQHFEHVQLAILFQLQVKIYILLLPRGGLFRFFR